MYLDQQYINTTSYIAWFCKTLTLASPTFFKSHLFITENKASVEDDIQISKCIIKLIDGNLSNYAHTI